MKYEARVIKGMNNSKLVHFVGVFDTEKEAEAKLMAFIEGLCKTDISFTRMIFFEERTVFDYGSWTMFGEIRPINE